MAAGNYQPAEDTEEVLYCHNKPARSSLGKFHNEKNEGTFIISSKGLMTFYRDSSNSNPTCWRGRKVGIGRADAYFNSLKTSYTNGLDEATHFTTHQRMQTSTCEAAKEGHIMICLHDLVHVSFSNGHLKKKTEFLMYCLILVFFFAGHNHVLVQATAVIA